MKVSDRIAELESLRKKYPKKEKIRKPNLLKHVESIDRELENLRKLNPNSKIEYEKSSGNLRNIVYDEDVTGTRREDIGGRGLGTAWSNS